MQRGVLGAAALTALTALAVVVVGGSGGGPGIDARSAAPDDTPAVTAPGDPVSRQADATPPDGGTPAGGSAEPGPPDQGAAKPGAAPGQQLVSYRGLAFEVPADWPVYDLEADPTVCVRFDVSAVYLGHPGPDMRCPAQLFGRADAVLVEPLDGSTVAEQADEPGDVNGLAVAKDRSAAAEHQVRAAFLDHGLAVTISISASGAPAGRSTQAPGRSVAETVLSTFRGVAK